MADYSYTEGDGLAVIDELTPDGAVEPVSVTDDAIRQIKAYLKDATVGPKALIDALSASLIPKGLIAPFAGTSAPDGWLFCDGSAVSRTTYAALFAAIGTTYGAGDGSTTFNLPDYRGRSFQGDGTGDASDATSWSQGTKAGTETHTLTTTEIPSHSHDMSSERIQADGNAPNAGGMILGSASGAVKNTAAVGGGAAHNNMPPVLVSKVIIKY